MSKNLTSQARYYIAINKEREIIEERIREMKEEMRESKNKIRKYNKYFLWASPFVILFFIIAIGFAINNLLNSSKILQNIFFYGIVVIINIGLCIYWIWNFNYYRKKVKQDKIDILKEMVEELSDDKQEN